MRWFLLSIAGLTLGAMQPDPAILRKVFEDAVARSERLYGAEDARTAQAARDLGFYLKEAGEGKAAIAAFSKALKIDEAKSGATSRQVLAGLIALASVSPPQDAEPLLRRVLTSPEINSPLAVLALSGMGDLRQSGKAAGYYRLALREAEAFYGKESEDVGRLLNSLAQTVDPKEAVDLLERAAALARKRWGDRHPATASCDLNLSRGLLRVGRAKEAAAKAGGAVDVFGAALGSGHPRVAAALTTQADALRTIGDKAAAAAAYKRAIEIDRLAFGANDARTVADTKALTSLLRSPKK